FFLTNRARRKLGGVFCLYRFTPLAVSQSQTLTCQDPWRAPLAAKCFPFGDIAISPAARSKARKVVRRLPLLFQILIVAPILESISSPRFGLWWLHIATTSPDG